MSVMDEPEMREFRWFVLKALRELLARADGGRPRHSFKLEIDKLLEEIERADRKP